MKRILVWSVVAFSSLTIGFSQATPVTTHIDLPVDFVSFNPCSGEDVHFQGIYAITTHVVQDNAGGGHMIFILNPNDVVGEGLSSGRPYRCAGITRDSLNFRALPFEETFVEVINIVAPGQPHSNFLIKEVAHITINAQGVVSVLFDRFSAECR